ncbi:hypothetical protein ACG93T_03520 [Acinetobacter beijerinckii]|uniref:hypothetical protein n=1 Tax=Acinetobacter TaxID=469 RepID=UPI0011AE7064|nr:MULTISPECIES: hypothetical protein [Acinetobacter]
MRNKFIVISAFLTVTTPAFALEETVFQCETKPKGLVKVVRNNSLYKINITKNGVDIFSFSKDYKKNTKKNFIEFNYSGGNDLVAIGLVMGYFGKDKNTIHSIFVDEAMTHRVSYDVDNIPVLMCVNNENYINNFKKIDKEKKLPAFYYD